MRRRYLLTLCCVAALLWSCGGEKKTPVSEANTATTPTPASGSADEAKPDKPSPSAAPRPDEPPALQDGLYEGTFSGPREGTVRWKVVGGAFEEATATAGDQTFALKGKISGRRITLGGKLDDDFMRLMGMGSEALMSGSWMAQFAGETQRGSWSCERKIVAEPTP